jgi:hypothetical protein
MTCFEYAKRRIAVRWSNEASLAWLPEFLCPAFQQVDSDSADWTISVENDSERFDHLIQQLSSPLPESVECFTLDGRFQSHELLQRNGNCLIARDRKHSIIYTIDQNHSKVHIFESSDQRHCRMSVARVIRELATVHSLNTGLLHCHGAAFSIGGKAIVLAGVKRSGKTSNLIHAMYQPTAQFITNDRLFVQCDGERPLVRGMPTIFKIRSPTLDLLPDFRKRRRARPYHFLDTLQESQHEFPARRLEMFGKRNLETRLSTAQFCDLMGVSAIGESTLGAIMFPKISPHVDRVHIEPLAPEVAGRKLFTESLLKASSPQRTAPAFRRSDESSVLDDEEVKSQCERIACQIPCYSCAIGPAAYEGPFLLDALQRRAA